MEKRKRGILSFMGEQNTQGQVVMVPLHKIEANPQQPRKIFNDESIAELTGSIKEYGVLQPIILRDEKNDTYTIIAGERRYRASQLAGLEKIPADRKSVV